MRIVVGGDWFWRCNALATAIVRRLIARYGPDIVIAHGGGNGVDNSFSVACRTLGIASDYRPVEFARVTDHQYQHREMLRPGAGLCIIVHRSLRDDERVKDLARQAIGAGVPTDWVRDEREVPWQLRPDSAPLA
jgi:hypothetical protein